MLPESEFQKFSCVQYNLQLRDQEIGTVLAKRELSLIVSGCGLPFTQGPHTESGPSLMHSHSGDAQVVPLALSHLLHPERYPRFTLLRQAIASARVGYEALSKVVPEVGHPNMLTHSKRRGTCMLATVCLVSAIDAPALPRTWSSTRQSGFCPEDSSHTSSCVSQNLCVPSSCLFVTGCRSVMRKARATTHFHSLLQQYLCVCAVMSLPVGEL